MEVQVSKVDDSLPPIPPVVPEVPKTNVVQLRPKKVVEEQKEMGQMRDVFMRRQKCLFENTFANGCKCGYCTFSGMMSQRVYEMIRNEFVYQAKKGSMIFTTTDIIDILQLTAEKVLAVENEQKRPPTPKK